MPWVLAGVTVIYWLLLQMLLLVSSVVTLVLVSSLTVLTHTHKRKLKAEARYRKTNISKQFLQDLEMDTEEIWKGIVTNGGSVQHLDFLDDWTKDVFKTAVEIDQRWIIDMAADRQKQICQSQSLNVFFPSDVSKQELHAIHMLAWKK